mgnify:CR=1 FL=1
MWAPTSEKVMLNLYETGDPDDKEPKESIEMNADKNGTWVAKVDGDLNGTYYTYSSTIDGSTKKPVIHMPEQLV